MTDPGLADRIRHAAHVSRHRPVRSDPFVTPDQLTVERRHWRRGVVGQELRASHRALFCMSWQAWVAVFWIQAVWWTREGLRCR